MKTLNSILCLIVLLLGTTTTFAQAKEEKEIVIVTKTIDENGKEITEKITLTGEEAEKYMKENGMKITEKVKNGKKEIEVEVTNNGRSEKEVSVWISDDGSEHKMEEGNEIHFYKEGEEIPEEVLEMLKEKGIDIDELRKQGDSGGIKMIEIDVEGNEKVIEWDGEGEMPAEMKKEMEKKGIDQTIKKIEIEEDIDFEMNEVETEDGKTIMIKKIKNGDEELRVIKLEKGEELPTEVLEILKENDIDPDDLKEEGRTRIKIEKEIKGSDDDEEIKIIKIEKNYEEDSLFDEDHKHEGHKHDGHKHEDHKHESHKSKKGQDGHRGKRDKKERISIPMNKAQMGVLIEAHGTGVKVNQVIKGGAAQLAGLAVNDVITSLNKIQVTDINSVLEILSAFEPGDKVKVAFIRGGKTMKKKLTLQETKRTRVKSSYMTKYNLLNQSLRYKKKFFRPGPIGC